MFVCCECCVLSGRGHCEELITRPEESYRLWCVVVCDLETSWMRRPGPTGGYRAKKNGSQKGQYFRASCLSRALKVLKCKCVSFSTYTDSGQPLRCRPNLHGFWQDRFNSSGRNRYLPVGSVSNEKETVPGFGCLDFVNTSCLEILVPLAEPTTNKNKNLKTLLRHSYTRVKIYESRPYTTCIKARPCGRSVCDL